MTAARHQYPYTAEQAIEQQTAGEPFVDPLAPLEHVVGWIGSTTLHVLIGIVLGAIAARVLRHYHLRWTWSACAFGLVAIAHSEMLGWATTVGTAALVSAKRGFRWHREDLAVGADLAAIARERRGPLDMARPLVRRLGERLGSRFGTVSAQRWLPGDRLIVGRGERNEHVSIPLGGPHGGTHSLVVGAAGSGKTVSQQWIALSAIEDGMGSIVIDPKGDPGLRGELAHAARRAGQAFIEWSPSGPFVYNPYGQGTPTEIADKALAGERFTEPHYQRQAQRYLGHEVSVLRNAGVEVTLDALARHLDPDRLELLARKLPQDDAVRTYEYVDALTTRQRNDLSGVRDRLAIMAESDIAPWLDPSSASSVETFNILGALLSRAVVYFDLQADSRPLLAQMLAVAIVLDLQTACSALQRRPTRAVAVIDEFAAIPTDRIAGLFARARGAGVNLVLGTQELADLRVPGREAVHDQVLGNLSALIAHRQVVPESAELISRLGGTAGAWSTTQHSDGRWTRTRRERPVIAPEALRGLDVGEAVVVTFGADSAATVTRMFSPKGGAR
jgi:conjugal transfer pilus assembly protein TraD